jgi:hypothetical protein
VRRPFTLFSLALLVLPLWDAAAAAARDAELWRRLRTRARVAPDTGWDREYRALIPYLPPVDPIGLVQALPGDTAIRERHYYFLQYAMAPRLVMPGVAPEFVVVQGAAADAERAIDPATFTLIDRFGDDFALYRRTRR